MFSAIAVFTFLFVGLVAGQTRLMLNTRATPGQPTPIDVAAAVPAIQQTTFVGSRPTKVLIHGYLDNYNAVHWQVSLIVQRPWAWVYALLDDFDFNHD